MSYYVNTVVEKCLPLVYVVKLSILTAVTAYSLCITIQLSGAKTVLTQYI